MLPETENFAFQLIQICSQNIKLDSWQGKYSYQIASKGINHYYAPPANSILYIIN